MEVGEQQRRMFRAVASPMLGRLETEYGVAPKEAFEHCRSLIEEDEERLNKFAGGEIAGAHPAWRLFLLQLTAMRYVLHKLEGGK